MAARKCTPHARACAHCGAAFVATYARAKRQHCSDRCRLTLRRLAEIAARPLRLCACGKPLPKKQNRKHCSLGCKEKAQRLTPAGIARALRSRAKTRQKGRTDRQRYLDRARRVGNVVYHAQKREKGKSAYAQWREAVGRGRYSGSCEEYAEYRERKALGCGRAEHWTTRRRTQRKPRTPGRYAHLTAAERYRLRYHSDPAYRLRERMRRQFTKWIRGERKSAPSFLGSIDYTWQQLRSHIERQFAKGMSWSNSGEWHIDHIVPKRLFEPLVGADVRACWALSNLRPLWKDANLAKNATRLYLV